MRKTTKGDNQMRKQIEKIEIISDKILCKPTFA
jgi:hypothetical protein